MQEHQTTYIILTWANGRREQVRAPDFFPWDRYPEEFTLNGHVWRYVGTTAATPYYHELRGADAPTSTQGEQAVRARKPLDVLQEKKKAGSDPGL